jgi:hypothetical protein
VAAGLAAAVGCDDARGSHDYGDAAVTSFAGMAAVDASGTTGAAGMAGPSLLADARPFTGAGGTIANPASTGPLADVVPTPGCGQPAPPTGPHTIMTMGMKDADCADKACGTWMYTREYFVNLPSDYDGMKAYPLVLEGPGCGGKGNNLFNNPTLARLAIRIGLSPSAEAAAIHATNPNQGCFDHRDGDDSVEWAFYENLWDQLATQLCFDQNRVFAAGNSAGGDLANQLGCKYAGDAKHPIRGVLSSNGILSPSEPAPGSPQLEPTCSGKPMAGIWVWGKGGAATTAPNQLPIPDATPAIERALKVNGCAASRYAAATSVPFAISATDTTSCVKLEGCPDATPLVACGLPISPRNASEAVINPSWVAFLKLFLASPGQ